MLLKLTVASHLDPTQRLNLTSFPSTVVFQTSRLKSVLNIFTPPSFPACSDQRWKLESRTEALMSVCWRAGYSAEVSVGQVFISR